MRHKLQLEVDIDDYATLPGNAWDLIVHEVITGAGEYLAYRFGSAVHVRLPPAPPTYDPTKHR